MVNRGVIIPEVKEIAFFSQRTFTSSLQNIKLYKAPEVGLGLLARKLNKLEFFSDQTNGLDQVLSENSLCSHTGALRSLSVRGGEGNSEY